MNATLLQVISTCPQDSAIIEQCGAQRIQLVSALEIGGVTPSASIIRKSLQRVSIPTNVIIRHHNNGFQYTQEEKQLMISDVILCKQFKAQGVVIGSLNEKLMLDEEFVQQVMKQRGNMNVTFHKASDQTPDLSQAFNKLSDLKVNTMLTQGGTKNIVQNIQILKKLPNNLHTKVLLGGGINHENIKLLKQQLNPTEVHIGTCVRQPKYGNVNAEKLKKFISLI